MLKNTLELQEVSRCGEATFNPSSLRLPEWVQHEYPTRAQRMWDVVMSERSRGIGLNMGELEHLESVEQEWDCGGAL